MRFLNAGDSALVVEFGNEISEAINRTIKFVTDALDRANLQGVLDLTPTYRSILINFDPLRVPASSITDFVTKTLAAWSGSSGASGGEVIEIPVLYGGGMGPDLDFICKHTGLGSAEVIRRHSSIEYLIYMLGFTPGFAYLGGMPAELATPRLAKPRALIPAGSVGIAAAQTGIYPVESPGGWQLLGRTPLKIFNYERSDPFLLAAGSYLKFVPISGEEYEAIEKAENEGSYQPKRYRKAG
ncbi:MAG: 5-oxoprolinase subunit PxpB [Spirochaetales bacterium]|jgi:KipI family sensor histidine kinase inhibitor|nr:5-oxoprolinase subunit PxpB [Spirochaetales bacterium]